jgi:hypothetical protein
MKHQATVPLRTAALTTAVLLWSLGLSMAADPGASNLGRTNSLEPTASQKPNAVLPELRKVRREYRGMSGTVEGYIDFFYRGKKPILVQITFIRPFGSGAKVWRQYRVDDVTFFEEDYGPGKPQLISVLRDGFPYEKFRRSTNGTVEPVASDELAKRQAQFREIESGFVPFVKAVRAAIETNSVEDVMGELRREVRALKSPKAR